MAPKDDKKIDFDDDYDEKETKSVFEEYVRSTIAEFIGTFFYVFIACLVVTSKNLIAMAFAEGLAIAVLCTAFINVRYVQKQTWKFPPRFQKTLN